MKKIHLALVGTAVVLGLAAAIGAFKVSADAPVAALVAASGQTSNIYMENGTQIVEIRAKGGYLPESSTLKAGVPTVLRLVTTDTFDCSSSVVIPALQVRRRLPLSGKTDIALASPGAGTAIKVYCSMGMYSFDLNFLG